MNSLTASFTWHWFYFQEWILILESFSQQCIILFISDEIPCSSDNPCINGGTCIGTLLNYQCLCPNGYTGTNCESKQ